MANTLIYLVDDDELYLKTAVHNLSQNKGLTIKTFMNGESLIKALNKKPDIVILDYFLDSEKPEAMSGIKVLQEIKQIAPDVEVLMLSGQEDIDVAVNSVKYGAVDYIVKNKSAFIRVQNDIKRIMKGKEKDKENAGFKKVIMISAIFIAVVIAFLIVYYFDKTVFGLLPDPGAPIEDVKIEEVVAPH
jgi:two-component system OmpR family response regulator